LARTEYTVYYSILSREIFEWSHTVYIQFRLNWHTIPAKFNHFSHLGGAQNYIFVFSSESKTTLTPEYMHIKVPGRLAPAILCFQTYTAHLDPCSHTALLGSVQCLLQDLSLPLSAHTAHLDPSNHVAHLASVQRLLGHAVGCQDA